MAKKSNSKVKPKAKAKAKPVKKVKPKPVKAAAKPKVKAKSTVKPKAKAPVGSGAKAKSKVVPKAKVQKKPAATAKALPVRTTVPKLKAKVVSAANKPVIITEKVNEKKMNTTKGSENGFKLRYNDKDLVEFKTIINGKLSDAKKDLDLLRSSMSHTDDHGTDDTSPTFKLMEDGSDVLTKEETAQLASRQQKFIKHLEDALVRIENKSYGICRATGNLIPKERLRIVPHATLSIEAKQKQF